MAGIGISPSKLANPIPGAEEAQAVQAAPANMPAMQGSVNQQNAPSLDELFQDTQVDSSLSLPQVPTQESSTSQVSLSDLFTDDASNSPESMKSPPPEKMSTYNTGVFSFANNDEERQHMASKLYGKGAKVVRVNTDDEWDFVIKRPDGSFIEPAGEAWSVDKLARYARLGTNLGAFIGTEAAITATTAGTGLLAGLAASSAAGVVAVENVRKALLEDHYKQMGLGEAAQEIAIDTTLNLAGVGVGKAIGKVGSRLIKGKAVSKGAAEAGEQAVKMLESTNEEVTALTEAGLAKAMPDDFKPVTVAEATKNRFFEKVQDTIKDSEAYQIFEKARGTWLEDVSENITKGITQLKGKVEGGLYGKAKDTLKSALLEEGGQLSKIREGFVKEAESATFKLSNTTKALDDVGEYLGMKDASGAWLSPNKVTTENLVARGVDEKTAKELLPQIKDVQKFLFEHKGEVTAGKLEFLRKKLDIINKNLWESDATYLHRQQIGTLRKALRQDFISSAETVFKEKGVADIYNVSMKNYSDLAHAQDMLASVLKRDDMSVEAFAKQIFNKGAAGADRLNNIKLVLQDSPEVWHQIKTAWLDELGRASTPSGGSLDVAKYLRGINSMGESLDVILDGTKVTRKHLQIAENLAGKIQEGQKSFKGNHAGAEKLMESTLYAMSNSMFMLTRIKGIVGLMKGLDKEGAASMYLKQQGIENVVAKLNPASRVKARTAFREFLEQAEEKGSKALIYGAGKTGSATNEQRKGLGE